MGGWIDRVSGEDLNDTGKIRTSHRRMESSVLLREHTNFSEYPVEGPQCSEWRKDTEGPFFHLAHMMLLFGFMAGSGLYALLYMFAFLALGFLCASAWAWSSPCNSAFLWAFVLFVICVVQVVHAAYRLRSVSFNKEFQELYARLFKRLGVSLTHFGRIVASSEREICTVQKEHYFAMEGKTPIDKLSILLSGRSVITLTFQQSGAWNR